MQKLFSKDFNFIQAIDQTREIGYCFAQAIHPLHCARLESELQKLVLEEGDHINYPINAGTQREVRQLHQRAYLPIGHQDIPIATDITHQLVEGAKIYVPELDSWQPTEAGYQRYRDANDWISPHRDRRNDQLLSATITIKGSALVRMYEPAGHPDNYTNLRPTFDYVTRSGTLMLLRAPGFGTGEQCIHEVFGPEHGPRLILNLRMRPNILRSPKEFETYKKA